MKSTPTTVIRQETLNALTGCVQARKDLDAAWNVYYATISKTLDSGTNAEDLAGQLGVSRSTIYQLAANGKDLDPELFPPAEDELIPDVFDEYPDGITMPALLSSRLDIHSAEEQLMVYTAWAYDRGIGLADIAATIGYSDETVSDLLDRYDGDSCWNCGEMNDEHTKRERGLCQEEILSTDSLNQHPTKLTEAPP